MKNFTEDISNDLLSSDTGIEMLGDGKCRSEDHAGCSTFLSGHADAQDFVCPDHDAGMGQPGNPLQFKAGELPTEVTLSTSGNRLLAKIYSTSELVLVEHFLAEDKNAHPDNPLQQIKASEGKLWNLPAILSKAFAGMGGVEEGCDMLIAEAMSGPLGFDLVKGGLGDELRDGDGGMDGWSGQKEDDMPVCERLDSCCVPCDQCDG